jgi:hypothetical protein
VELRRRSRVDEKKEEWMKSIEEKLLKDKKFG